MPSLPDKFDLLTELEESYTTDYRPWGDMLTLGSQDGDLTVKFITCTEGQRTSLQYHKRKDELLLTISGCGFVEVNGLRFDGDGHLLRVRPGVSHRVTGPLVYLEISKYDDGTDTIRLEDDYGR